MEHRLREAETRASRGSQIYLRDVRMAPKLVAPRSLEGASEVWRCV